MAFISVSFGIKFGNISTYSSCSAFKSYEYTALQMDSVSSPIFRSVMAKLRARLVSMSVVPRRACNRANLSILSRSASESCARVLNSSSKWLISTCARTDSSSRSLKMVPATCVGFNACQFNTGNRYLVWWRAFTFRPDEPKGRFGAEGGGGGGGAPGPPRKCFKIDSWNLIFTTVPEALTLR